MGTKREDPNKDPLFRKYAKIARNDFDPEKKMKPSEFFKAAPNFFLEGYPKIIELMNMADNTAEVKSTVDTDQPLFQASPKVLIFDNYAPFSVVERKLFFRNNDSVSIISSTLSESVFGRCNRSFIFADSNTLHFFTVDLTLLYLPLTRSDHYDYLLYIV